MDESIKDIFTLISNDGTKFVLIRKEIFEQLTHCEAREAVPGEMNGISLEQSIHKHISLDDLPF